MNSRKQNESPNQVSTDRQSGSRFLFILVLVPGPTDFGPWIPGLNMIFKNSKAHEIVFNSSKPGSYQLVRSIAANMSGRTYFRTF